MISSTLIRALLWSLLICWAIWVFPDLGGPTTTRWRMFSESTFFGYSISSGTSRSLSIYCWIPAFWSSVAVSNVFLRALILLLFSTSWITSGHILLPGYLKGKNTTLSPYFFSLFLSYSKLARSSISDLKCLSKSRLISSVAYLEGFDSSIAAYDLLL